MTNFNKGPLFDGGQPRDLALTGNELVVYSGETTQRNMLGARYLTWDGRVYKYMLANGTLNPDLGCEQARPQEIAFASVAVAASIGDIKVKLTVGASDGVAGDGVIAKDVLQGGYLVVFISGQSKAFTRLITGNDAATSGSTITIDIDVPLHIALTTSDSGEAMASPYYKVTTGSSTARSIIAIPTIAATSAQFCWGQTWGPHWIAPQADVGAGASAIQCVFRHDGSIEVHDAGSATTLQKQHAGFVMSWSQSSTQGAPFMMLQISI